MQISKILKERVAFFCKTTTLHGLKYIGQPAVSAIERIFWFLSFACAVGFAGYFISNIFDKYIHNRVIVSISSNTVSANDIPFPTVIICNMNRVNKLRAEAILRNGSELNKKHINNLCKSNKTASTQSTATTQSKEDFLNFVIELSPSCQEMIKVCMWLKEEVNCSDIFSTVLTDIGACCSFNQLPLSYILRNPMNISALDVKHSEQAQDWNFEKGYMSNSTNKTLPRTLTDTGLTVVLDTEIDKYYCSSSNSVGFKVATSNPTEIPRMENFAINILPGLENSIAAEPVLTEATDDIRSNHITNRQCYFNNERYLMFFRTYTMNNCLTECQANYTLRKCGCIPYFLIVDSYLKYCEREHETCITEVLELVAHNEKPLHQRSQCNCLPSCFEYSFTKHISYGRLSSSFKIHPKYIKNQSTGYFETNALVLNIYFTKASFTKYSKSEIYGHIELLSNMGGLLAIFLGFSFLSAAEIVYHLFCKIFPVIFQYIHDRFIERRKIYPFVK